MLARREFSKYSSNFQFIFRFKLDSRNTVTLHAKPNGRSSENSVVSDYIVPFGDLAGQQRDFLAHFSQVFSEKFLILEVEQMHPA